jgi:hypothetical protein
MRSATLLVTLASIAAVSAFVPIDKTTTIVREATALNVIDPKKEIGVQEPVGFFE